MASAPDASSIRHLNTLTGPLYIARCVQSRDLPLLLLDIIGHHLKLCTQPLVVSQQCIALQFNALHWGGDVRPKDIR